MPTTAGLTIGDAFDLLPLSEATLAKRMRAGSLPFAMLNDMGHPCEYRVVLPSGEDLGMVKYYRGRKLACYGYAEGR